MKKPIKSLILFGDSLLGRFGRAPMDAFEELVGGVTVYNCAAGGQNTDDGARRAPYIGRLKPDFVVISFGANDAAFWKLRVPLAHFRKNLHLIFASFKGSKIIVFPCPPVNDPSDPVGTKKYNADLRRYNDVLFEVAKKFKATCIDSLQIFSRRLKEGNDYHLGDGLHLNEEGYAILIKELVRTVKILR